MLPLAPFMPFISGAILAFWFVGIVVSWTLRKAWPLRPVREPPVLAIDDKVHRTTIGRTRYPIWACLRGQTGWVHVAVEIASDGVYRTHRIVDASPPAVFDRAVARALAGTTYETTDGDPLPGGFETLYRFVPPERPKPRPAAPVTTPAAT